MLSTQMMKLAERNQWKTNNREESVFGTYNGYLFTAFEGKNFKTFITPIAGISPDGLDSVLTYLKKNQRTLSLYNYEASDNFLCIRQYEGWIKLSLEKMEYLLAQISGLLSLYELPTDACAVCGLPTRQKGLYMGLFCHLHPECQNAELTDFTGTDLSESQTSQHPDSDAPQDGETPTDDETPPDGDTLSDDETPPDSETLPEASDDVGEPGR